MKSMTRTLCAPLEEMMQMYLNDGLPKFFDEDEINHKHGRRVLRTHE